MISAQQARELTDKALAALLPMNKEQQAAYQYQRQVEFEVSKYIDELSKKILYHTMFGGNQVIFVLHFKDCDKQYAEDFKTCMIGALSQEHLNYKTNAKIVTENEELVLYLDITW